MSAVIPLEASTLGWTAWPQFFNYEGKRWELVHKCVDREGELMYVEYHPADTKQYASQIVRVFND